MIIGDRQGGIYALDLASGDLRWQAKFDRRLAALPVAVGDTLLLPTRDGLLHRLRWRPPSPLPAEPPAAYQARGEWDVAAVAHALAGDFSAAGRCLLQANRPEDPAHALTLFEKANDAPGRAEALAALERYDEAIPIAQELGDEERAADWLAQAGRHDEAGDAHQQLNQPGRAGEQYEKANRPLKAIKAYKAAGREAEARRLIDVMDPKLFNRLEFLPWRWRVESYQKGGQLAAAADLLEEHEEWEEALELRRRIRDWGRVREICWRLGDWRGEALAYCEMAGAEKAPRQKADRYCQAAQLYVEKQEWAQARTCYAAAGDRLQEAEMLARQGEYRPAGDLIAALTGLDSAEAAAAAGYYWQAAKAAIAQLPEWTRQDPGCAELFELAAKWYGIAGDGRRMSECQADADRWLRRPRLELLDGQMNRAFQQEAITTICLPLRNIGASVALQAQVLAGGKALGLEEPEPAANPVETLAPEQQKKVSISLQPKAYSAEGAPLQFDLWLQYRGQDGQTYTDGPFEIHQPVAMSMEQLLQSGRIDAKIFLAGSRYAEGDQVNITRPGVAGGFQVTAGGDQVVVGRNTTTNLE